MRVAIARDDTIVNVIEAPDLAVAVSLFPECEAIDADASAVGIGWVRNGEEWVPPEPEISDPVFYLNNGGLIRFTGPSPVEVLENLRMASVTRVAKGRYRAYHVEPYPTDQYSASLSLLDPNPRTIRLTARTDTYVEVRVTDLAGAAQDPQEITIKTEKVVSQ